MSASSQSNRSISLVSLPTTTLSPSIYTNPTILTTHLSNSFSVSSPLPPIGRNSVARLRPVDDFTLTKLDSLRDASLSEFPASLKITVWNCKGVTVRDQEIYPVMDEIGCDILVLTETFRFPGCPWSKFMPPCIGESTAIPLATSLKNSAGVAVLVNPDSVSSDRIKSFSILDVDLLHGSKVVMKINNFILFAAYTAPNPSGTALLRQFSSEALSLSQDGSPVVFCGDFNAHASLWGSRLTNDRGKIMCDLLTHRFFRADTGKEPTRPANRIDSVVTEGSIIDHIFGANIDLCHAKCHSLIAQSSDHRPISATVVPTASRADQSTKYWRIKLHKLKDPKHKLRFVQAVERILDDTEDDIVTLSSSVGPSASLPARRAVADSIEHVFVSAIMTAAKNSIGMTSVPVVAGSRPNRSIMSAEFLDARSNLRSVFEALRQLNDTPPDDPEVITLLDRRDTVRVEMQAIRRRDKIQSYKRYVDTANSLPARVLMKRISASRRRQAAAGASLSCTSVALSSYVRHFAAQFENSHVLDLPPLLVPSVSEDQRYEHCFNVISEDLVHECLMRSPTHKAPGISSLSADLLRPVADLIVPLLTGIFRSYLSLGVVPSSWTRALVCPVPKKGDLSQIKNYRPISLTEVTRKIYEMVLMRSLQERVTMSREQGGFRSKRSTIDQIECLDLLIKQAKKAHRRLPHLAFLDIKAAYDSVPRQVLWQRCVDLQIHPVTIESLWALFDHNSGQLVLNQHRSSPFPQPAGVLQG